MQKTLLLFLVLLPQFVLAWGKDGHQIVARVGSQLSKSDSFWQANTENMAAMTLIPDSVWKGLSTGSIEKPTHYFQPDAYYEAPNQFNKIPQSYAKATEQFKKDFVDENGTAVWRIPQLYTLAVNALKAGDFKTAVQMAGVMSHYVGDVAQPLHDTVNFDGQMTNQKGLHAFFESTNISAQNQTQLMAAVKKAASALLKKPSYVNKVRGDITSVAFAEVDRAYAELDDVLLIDKTLGRKGDGAAQQLQVAIARMADGAATLTILLNRIWADAGSPTGGSTVSIGTPTWVEPKYQSKMHGLENHEDDCDL